LSLKLKSNKCISQGFPKIEKVLSWYPVIRREFPEDENDFGGWNYD